MTTIVTGANRGIGLETARALAADTSSTIVLAGRDITGLASAVQEIQSSTGNESLVPMLVDLAALSSVRSFASEVRARSLPPLRTIICNAGISVPTARRRSADGYELTFATNHLAHFLLVNLLIDRLEPPARVLFVTSAAHDPAGVAGPMQPPRYATAEWLAYPERDPERLAEDRAAGGRAYASSKLCNVLCTYELARRLEGVGVSTDVQPITANAFAPGLVAGTGLGRYERGWTRFAWHYLMPVTSRVMGFGRTPAQAGADLAYLATAATLRSVTGKYFRQREIRESSAASYDEANAADLWATSVKLSHLQPGESPLLGDSAQ
jgi:NAD(P)-dependent dehydrogenase (short-subunit alcohol dehydrogenase family)